MDLVCWLDDADGEPFDLSRFVDHTRWIRPIAHLWTASRQGGVHVPGDVLCFEGQPQDFTPVLEAWRRAHPG